MGMNAYRLLKNRKYFIKNIYINIICKYLLATVQEKKC